MRWITLATVVCLFGASAGLVDLRRNIVARGDASFEPLGWLEVDAAARTVRLPLVARVPNASHYIVIEWQNGAFARPSEVFDDPIAIGETADGRSVQINIDPDPRWITDSQLGVEARVVGGVNGFVVLSLADGSANKIRRIGVTASSIEIKQLQMETAALRVMADVAMLCLIGATVLVVAGACVSRRKQPPWPRTCVNSRPN